MEAIALKRIDDGAVMEALTARLDRQGRGQAAAAAHRHLDQGPDARASPSSSPNAATRSPATGSSACGAKARGSRSTRSAATAWRAASTPTGSISPGATRRDGGTARLAVVIKNQPGSLAVVAGILGSHGANIVSMDQTARDGSFHTFHFDIEVHDLPHLMRILAALRATEWSRPPSGSDRAARTGWRPSSPVSSMMPQTMRPRRSRPDPGRGASSRSRRSARRRPLGADDAAMGAAAATGA